MIYLAPLQGFTDFVYRKVYAELIRDVDAFFIPYITTKNHSIPLKYNKEIIPEHNGQKRVVPQILAENGSELLFMAGHLEDLGYREINLNMGCPYPMVTNRGKGSGLLPFPEKIEAMLDTFFASSNLELSVKLRAGLHTDGELAQVIPVLNKYPVKEVILHPRVATQLYTGQVSSNAYKMATENLNKELVFNGDIFSVMDFKSRQQEFPTTSKWMLGRGILMNPFLPLELNGIKLTEEERREKLRLFHDRMLEHYIEQMDNEGNALNKMKQFWIYFSHNFSNPAKLIKGIKKAKNRLKYTAAVQQVFYG